MHPLNRLTGSSLTGGLLSRWAGVWLVTLACVTIGCRSDSDETGASGSGASGSGASGSGERSSADGNTPDLPRFSVDQLGSPLGGHLPPLDSGRIEVAPPVRWYVESRDKRYITRFVVDRRHRTILPRITVTAEDAPFEDPMDLDAANLADFCDLVTERFSEATQKALLEHPKCLILGDVPCLRYVVSKRFRRGDKEMPAECQVIKTLHQGRIYTVSLDVFAGKLLDYHNDAYAVVAGLVFHHVDVQPDTEATVDDTEAMLPEEDTPKKDDDKDEEIDPFG